jgi:hypothetical protein
MKRAETQAEYNQQMAEYTARRDAAMKEAGVAVGDKVEWHNVGAFFNMEILTGTLYLTKRGQPKVKLTDGRAVAWHKGFTKV